MSRKLKYISNFAKIDEEYAIAKDGTKFPIKNSIILIWGNYFMLYPTIMENKIICVGYNVIELDVVYRPLKYYDSNGDTIICNENVYFDYGDDTILRNFHEVDSYVEMCICENSQNNDVDAEAVACYRLINDINNVKQHCFKYDNFVYLEDFDADQHTSKYEMSGKVIECFYVNKMYYALVEGDGFHQLGYHTDIKIPGIINVKKFGDNKFICVIDCRNYIMDTTNGKLIQLPRKNIAKIFYDHITFTDGTIVDDSGDIVHEIYYEKILFMTCPSHFHDIEF